MEETSISSKLSDYLIKTYPITETSKGSQSKIRVADFIVGGTSLAKRFHHKFIKDNKKDLANVLGDLVFESDDKIIQELNNILPTIQNRIEDHMLETRVSKTKVIDTDMNKDFFISLVPVIDIESPKAEAKMLISDTLRYTDVTESSWAKIVGQQHAKAMYSLGYAGSFEYNPTTTNPLRKENTTHGVLNYYNTYIPPVVKLNLNTEAKLDQRFIDFLNHFFKDSCRQYAVNWIRQSQYEKMEAYLLLVGAGGTGKNLLASAIGYLHGLSNFHKAPASALNSKFNGHLLGCTMVYYDECKFTTDKNDTAPKNRLKEWANQLIPIEKKGQDSKDVEIYCSAIISTNNDSDVHLSQLDRKFSPMEITNERLELVFDPKTVKWLWDYIATEEFPHAFHNWLEQNRTMDFKKHTEYRGERFNQLVLSSLTTWEQQLLDLIQTKKSKEYTIKFLKENIPYFPFHKAKVEDFLRSFKVEGKTLGSITLKEGYPVVKVSEHFSPEEDKPDLESGLSFE